MNAPRFDAVIAGGGLSGLSLAAHLATGGWRDHSVLVIDDIAARPSAVCWGFWSAAPGLLDPAVSRRYRQVRIHAAGTAHVVPLGPYRYQVVRRPDLYRVVMGLLDGCPGFAVRQGRVECLRDGVDARLAFTGWEVRCDRPVFDPRTPILFDFRTPQVGGARFVYVLPHDAHR